MRIAASRTVGLALVACVATNVQAQAFKAGTNYIGPSVSLATYGSAIAFAGNFEHAINDQWGGAVSVGYYSFIGFKYIPIAVTAVYHFKVTNDKLDPFVGGGLGLNIVSTSFDDAGYNQCVALVGAAYCNRNDYNFGGGHSGIFPIINGGVRYWFSDKIALVGRAGYGLGYLSVGVDFKM